MDNQQHEPEEIKCPACKSTNWRCYDESYSAFEDASTGEFYDLPLGSMVCEDCQKAFVHHDWYGEDGKKLLWIGQ